MKNKIRNTKARVNKRIVGKLSKEFKEKLNIPILRAKAETIKSKIDKTFMN
jgi:hypothetical protein